MSKPLFERRHFAWLARYCYENPSGDAKSMAMALEHTNPNFDRQRFVKAASGNPNGKESSMSQPMQNQPEFKPGNPEPMTLERALRLLIWASKCHVHRETTKMQLGPLPHTTAEVEEAIALVEHWWALILRLKPRKA
jgi:hypothetical protein